MASTKPGMKVTISIECQRCHFSMLRLKCSDLTEAEEIAEAKGWMCSIRHGWTCPTCQ